MTRIEQSVIIPAPLVEVFAFASDYRKWADWFVGVSAFTPTTAVTEGNGAQYAYKARMMGFSMRIETEIHDFIPNQGWRGVSIKGDVRTFWAFQPVGDNTRFTYSLEYTLPLPWLSSFVDTLFMKSQTKRTITTSLENLRRYFADEANKSTVPPESQWAHRRRQPGLAP